MLPAADFADFDDDFDARARPAAFAAEALVRSFEPRWVSALPAADLAAFDEDFDARVRPAALAALLLVCRPLGMACSDLDSGVW